MENYIEERALLYTFLSRGFLKEVDRDYLDTVTGMDYKVFDENGPVDEGFRLMGRYAARTDSQTLLNLARDYARTFFGAGLAKNDGAYPYESVYTSADRLLMQEARDEVMKWYAAEELGRSGSFAEPEDHIAFELEFMAHLCKRAGVAIKEGDTKAFYAYMVKQKEFLCGHLGKWAPAFCDDVIKTAREDFYIALAMITKGFLEEEAEVLEELSESYSQR